MIMSKEIENKIVQSIGIIGDIHGKVNTYSRTIRDFDATIQVGDFGFRSDWEKLSSVDSYYHKILPGNHEDYDYIDEFNPNHSLGDFGQTNFHGLEFFFLRGAYSIDQSVRTRGLDWWNQEQLNYVQLTSALNVYDDIRPEVVITHTMPLMIVNVIFKHMSSIPCSTSTVLDRMFEIHQPKLWILGHFHPYKVTVRVISGTTFVVLPSAGTIEYHTNKTLDENIRLYNKYYNT